MDTHPDSPDLPVSTPGDTARVDQLAAIWRDLPAAARDRVEAAAADVQGEPSGRHVTALMDALMRAGLTGSGHNAGPRP